MPIYCFHSVYILCRQWTALVGLFRGLFYALSKCGASFRSEIGSGCIIYFYEVITVIWLQNTGFGSSVTLQNVRDIYLEAMVGPSYMFWFPWSNRCTAQRYFGTRPFIMYKFVCMPIFRDIRCSGRSLIHL